MPQNLSFRLGGKKTIPSDLFAFCCSRVAREYFEKTFAHPTFTGKISWVPTEFLLKIANPTPLAESNTGGADGRPDQMQRIDQMLDSMQQQGMRDPMFLGVGTVSRRIRLEAGNNRIAQMLERGLTYLPTVALVAESHISFEANGTHNGISEGTDGLRIIPAAPALPLNHYSERSYQPVANVVEGVPNYPCFGFADAS